MQKKLNEVQQRLLEIDATKFHKMVDTYLNKKYNYSIHSTGTKTGEDKPRKGTPDTLIALDNKKYIFVEYTTQKTNIKKKFLEDIEKCLEPEKTNISLQKIDKIILACNSSLQSDDIEALKVACGDIECEVLTNSTLSYDFVNHYPFIAKDFLGIDIGNVLSSDILKENYLNKFSTISLLINDTPKPIEDIFINLAIIKEQKENKQDKNLISREALLNSYEEIHKPKEPIEIEELINISNKSLIYGKAGIGKTTLCKFIAYKWAKSELYSEFEYVVYLPLREWKRGGILQAIKNYYFPLDSDDLSFELKGANALFLFDGYDELSGERKKDLRDEIEKYGLSHYIITTRPYGYQRNDFRVDEHFETIGFVDEDVEAYIDNFFEESEPKKRLKAFLNSNIGIKHIAYIPLMLEMICSLWQEQPFSDSLTMTELYSAVVESILKKHSAKKEDEAVYKRANRKKINSILGKLAFRGLTKQTILFDGDFIEEVIDEEDIEFFEKSVINSGFLKSDRQEKDLLDNSFEFLHLTFQEYFSALYVASLSKEEQSKIIRDWKFYPHMQVFFAFLGGLIEDKEFLLGEIESEPRDILGYYELLLLSDCLNEMKDYDNQVFIDRLNNKMILWVHVRIKISNLYDDIYRDVLYRIRMNKSFHTEQILNMLITLLIQLENALARDDIALLIPIVGQKIPNFIETVISIIRNPKISDLNTDKMSKSYNVFYQDNQFISKIITYIKKEKKEQHLGDMLIVLSSIGRSDEKIISLILDILEKKIITTYKRYTIRDNLEKLIKKSPNKKYKIRLDKYINEITAKNWWDNDDNYTYGTFKERKENEIATTASLVDKPIKNEDDFIAALIEILDDGNISEYDGTDGYRKQKALEAIKDYTNRDDTKIVRIILEYMKLNDNDLANYAQRVLSQFTRCDKEFIILLLDVVKDISIDYKVRYEVARKLFSIQNSTDFFIEELLFILEQEYISFENIFLTKSTLKNMMTFEIFERLYKLKLYEDDTVNQNYRKDTFKKNIKINVLFQAYNNNYNIEEILLSNLIFSNKPLYLKNNKLCTIENGIKISTQREINLEIINKIKTFIPRDNYKSWEDESVMRIETKVILI